MRDTVAEFHKDAGGRCRLFSLSVISEGEGQSTYDVEWSRAYGYMFYCSGFGAAEPVRVSGIYWTSRNLDVKESPCTLIASRDKPPYRSKETRRIRERNRTRRLRNLPKAFRLEAGQDLLGWLEQNAIEDQAVWCSTCRDWLPSESLCDHSWWCNEIGWYSTPDERCKCGERVKCESA